VQKNEEKDTPRWKDDNGAGEVGGGAVTHCSLLSARLPLVIHGHQKGQLHAAHVQDGRVRRDHPPVLEVGQSVRRAI
jgi:hypothetical protein